MTDDVIFERMRALQSWRPDADTAALIAFHARTGVPFCVECADWHAVGEEHSTTDFDKG